MKVPEFLRIAKWESKSLILNKRYSVSVLLISFLLSLFVPIFLNFVDTFQRGEVASFSPVLTSYIPVSIVGGETFPEFVTEMKTSTLFEIFEYDLDQSMEALHERRLAGVVLIDERNVTVFYDAGNPKKELLEDEMRYVASRAAGLVGNASDVYNLTLSYLTEEESPKLGFAAVVNGLLIPSLLILPLFMWSGALIESIINEKERKTMELIMAGPVRKSSIVLGKMLAVSILIGFLSVFWIGLLSFEGIIFGNPVGTYLILMLVGVFLVSVVALVTTLSKNFKEANIYVTIVTMGIFTFFAMITLTLYFPQVRILAELSPLAVIARLVSGEVYFPSFVVFTLSLLTIGNTIFTISLFEDEQTFFGTLNVQRVLQNLEKYLTKPFKRKEYSLIIFVIFGFFFAVLAGAVEVILFSIFLFLFGAGSFIPVMVLTPFVEELFKIYPILSFMEIRKEWFKDSKFSFLSGVSSGIGFSLAESTIIGLIVLALLPGFLSSLLFRSLTTALAHASFTGICCFIISKCDRKMLGITVAAAIHLFYNTVILVML
jgi:ABC-2 type transport system permease protein